MTNNAFTPLTDRKPISKLIFAQIEEAILTKKYQAGEKLPSETEFCKLFGVSRTSVREAIQKLDARGLIKVEKGKGIFVKPFTTKSVTDPLHIYLQMKLERDYVMDLVHARQIIEPAIAYYAAIYHDDKDIKILKDDIEMLEKSTGGYKELANLDSAFHLNIAKVTQNSIVPLFLEPIHKLMPQVKSFVYAKIDDARESAVTWHTRILVAIESRDAEGAREAMTEHLKIAEVHTEQMLITHFAQPEEEKNF